MSWNDIPGVEYRGMPSIACPLIIDLTIDGRPAYIRFRHGAVRLAFEDGGQEVVGQAIDDDEFDGAGEQKVVVGVVRDSLLPRLRDAARIARATSESSAVGIVRDFLFYAERSSQGMKLATQSMDYYDCSYHVASESEISKILSEWAARRDACDHNE